MAMDLNNKAGRNTSFSYISTQGSSFEKACLNLAKKELIDGEL